MEYAAVLIRRSMAELELTIAVDPMTSAGAYGATTAKSA